MDYSLCNSLTFLQRKEIKYLWSIYIFHKRKFYSRSYEEIRKWWYEILCAKNKHIKMIKTYEKKEIKMYQGSSHMRRHWTDLILKNLKYTFFTLCYWSRLEFKFSARFYWIYWKKFFYYLCPWRHHKWIFRQKQEIWIFFFRHFIVDYLAKTKFTASEKWCEFIVNKNKLKLALKDIGHWNLLIYDAHVDELIRCLLLLVMNSMNY